MSTKKIKKEYHKFTGQSCKMYTEYYPIHHYELKFSIVVKNKSVRIFHLVTVTVI